MNHRLHPTIVLCGTDAKTIAALADALARGGARVVRPAEPPGGDEASRRWCERVWKLARRVDAVAVCVALPRGPGRSAGGLGGWLEVADAALKPIFFLAKHALLRLARARRGTLVAVVPAPAECGPGRVVEAALAAMVEGLAKAMPRGVGVGALTGVPPLGRGAAAQRRVEALAEAVRTLAAQGPDTPARTVYRAPSRG